ncbi:MAG: NUDIX domain-containing protein [Chloroflexi bacterium]|nr:NUDIX domain-containing protein [Chloroflexota bacterium]
MTDLPQIAVGLIIAEDGRVLLQHRDDKPDILEPGVWALFGGHIDQHEDPAQAFLREMDEELGWRPKHFEHYRTVDLHLPAGARAPSPAGAAPAPVHLISNLFAAHLDVPLDALSLNEGQGMALHAPAALPERIATDLPRIFAEFAATDAYRRVRKSWDVISATAILVDARGRFLLQHRDDKPGIDNPGLWGSFGGAVDPYETPAAGFLREMREELDWEPKQFELHVAGPYFPDRRGYGASGARSQLIYIYTAPVDVPFADLTLNEGQAMGFFAPDALPEETVPAYRDLLDRFAATDEYRRLKTIAS